MQFKPKNVSKSTKTLKELIDFDLPLPSRTDYLNMFTDIAEAYLNRTLLVVKRIGKTEKTYYRAAEIEFYLNDGRTHKDTFTHGTPM